MSSVLHHLPQYKDALIEVSKVIFKGGILVINVPGDKPYVYLPTVLGRGIVKRLLYVFGMHHTFSPKSLFRELSDLGFKVVWYRYAPSLISMFVFELIAFLIMIERLRYITYSTSLLSVSPHEVYGKSAQALKRY